MAWRSGGSSLAVILAACILPLLGADDNSQGIDLSESMLTRGNGRRGGGAEGKSPVEDAVAEGGDDASARDSLLLIGEGKHSRSLALKHASQFLPLVSTDCIPTPCRTVQSFPVALVAPPSFPMRYVMIGGSTRRHDEWHVSRDLQGKRVPKVVGGPGRDDAECLP